LFIGYLIIGLIIPNKTKTIKYFFILLFAAVALSPIYLSQVLDNFQAREQAIDLTDEENLEKQARYQELNFAIDSWENGDLKHKLIGTDIFAAHEYFNLGRMLHTDYMTMLSGSGIIGLFGFLFIYGYIVFYLWRKRIRYKHAFFAYAFAVGAAIMVNFLFMGVSGIAQAVEPRATVFLFIGMLIGFKPAYFNTIKDDSTDR
jgi:O-antigen ligase